MVKINFQKNIDAPEFLFIFVDHNPWKEVCNRLFINHLVKIKKCKTKLELSETFNEVERMVALNYVLRLLSYRSYLTGSVMDKLSHRKISSTAIQYVIEKCQDYDYLNDDRESRNFIKAQLRRGVGTYLIEKKLEGKSGWQFEKIRSLTNQMITKEEQLQMIKKLIKRKYSDLDLRQLKNKQKVSNFLRRRGFSYEYILDQLQ